jgi:hypothetical protein
MVRRALTWSIAWLLLSCGRVHVLEDGSYGFSVRRVLRDDCGLESQITLSPAVLSTAGQRVTLDFSSPEARLAGTYRTSIEEMTLDGTIANSSTVVRGQECLLDFVTLHLDTVTVDAARFRGTMSITYYAPQLDACVCKYWFDFDASRAEP